LAYALSFAGAMMMASPMPTYAQAGPESVADLTEELIDAVVNISTTQTVNNNRRVPVPDLPPNTPFKEFFEEFFDKQQQGNAPRSQRQVSSLGSGFVIDSEGLIITNNHVIDGAEEITISFNDGTELDATLVGRDPKTDIAVLRVTPDKPLKSVKFANSDQTRVGDWALAIGNPFGLGGTVTMGIISAINRDINAGPYDSFIQTDAAINKGNSGGPLFDMNGNVIGVNTAIFSRSGGSVGVGFAVPANLAENVMNQLVAYGETRRGWLGVLIQPVSEGIAQSLRMDEPMGALVAQVTTDGPAYDGGVEPGDIILRFDGRDVPTSRDLPKMVAQTKIGKKVDVIVLRKGKEKALTIELGRLEDGEVMMAEENGIEQKPKPKASISVPVTGLDIEVSRITKEYQEQYNLAEEETGLVVVKVDQESSAYSKGIRPGSVIKEVDQKQVKTPADMINLVNKNKEDGIEFILIQFMDNEGNIRFDAVKID